MGVYQRSLAGCQLGTARIEPYVPQPRQNLVTGGDWAGHEPRSGTLSSTCGASFRTCLRVKAHQQRSLAGVPILLRPAFFWVSPCCEATHQWQALQVGVVVESGAVPAAEFVHSLSVATSRRSTGTLPGRTSRRAYQVRSPIHQVLS